MSIEAGRNQHHSIVTAPLAGAGLPSLRTNAGWSLAGTVVSASCSWGVLIVLAKLGQAEMLGQYALGLAIATPVILLANLSLRTVQATDARNQYVFGDYLALRLITVVIAMLVIVGITALGPFDWTEGIVLLIVGAGRALDAVADVFHGLFQRRERMVFIARSMMLNGTLSLVGCAAVLQITQSIILAVSMMTLASACVLVGYTIPSGYRLGDNDHGTGKPSTVLRPARSRSTLSDLARITLPMGIAAMLASLYVSVPRYFLDYELGTYELGVFAAISNLTMVGTLVIGAIAQAALPRLSTYYEAGQRHLFLKLTCTLALLGLLVAMLGVAMAAAIGSDVLAIVYTDEYARYERVLVWLAVGTGISYLAWFSDYAISAMRRFRLQLVLNCITFVVVAIACYVLVPTHGIKGAAWAVAVAMAAQVTLKALTLTMLLIRSFPSPALATDRQVTPIDTPT